MNDQPLISVIVPVYNVEPYLPKCLDTIIEQTYPNLEIICVNDGSTDSSREICVQYAMRDDRIKIVNKVNGGLSDTRNLGVANSHGEFILFIDSDDWLDLDCIERAMMFQQENKLDMLYFPYVKECGVNSVEVHPYQHSIPYDAENILYKRLFGLYGQEFRNPEMADSLCSACMKLYRGEILRNSTVRFVSTKEIGSYEDGLFNLQISPEMGRVGYLDRAMYHYRKTNSSSLTATYKAKLVEQWQCLFSIIETEIENRKYGEEYRLRLNNRIVMSLIGIGLNELCAHHSVFVKLKNIKAYLSSKSYRNAISTFEIQYLPAKWRVFFEFAKCRCTGAVYMLLYTMDFFRKRGIS